ncbi:MAG: hypothetical protein OHK0046_21030 [Anaerolineae bacterium]
MNPMSVVQTENARLKDENTQLRQEVSNLREFVRILDELSTRASRVKDDAEVLPLLDMILRHALDLLDAPEGTLALLDEKTHELVFVIVQGALSAQLTGYRISANEGIAGWVMQNAAPALVRDVRRDTRFFADIDEKFKFRTLSIAAAPLIGNGKVLGLIEVLNQPGDEPFSESDMALLKLMCRFAGEALAELEQ